MKKLYPSIFLAAIVMSAIAATVKISDLPISTSPSTNTFLEIADMDAATKSSKYLLTNLVTVAQGQASTNALTNTFVLKAGDSMSGALTGPSSTWTNGITAGDSTFTSTITITNDAISDVPLKVNARNGTTNNLVEVNSGGTNKVIITTDGALRVPIIASDANPAFSFVGATNTGIRRGASSEMRFIVGGTAGAAIDANGFYTKSGGWYGFSSSSDPYGATDLYLVRDAANTLAQRNGTNAQAFRVYNTYANSGTDYERGELTWGATANVLTLRTANGGTGSARNIAVYPASALYLGSANAPRWYVPTTGHLLAYDDNTYDIGASGATRPRNIYVGGLVEVASYVNAPTLYGSWRASTASGSANLTGDTTTATLQKAGGAALTTVTLNTASIVGGITKVLTDATATSAFYIAVANTNSASGHVVYTVTATDGTETQAISGDVKFASVAKGTAVTAQVADVQTTAAVSAGTLTCAVTANTATNNVLALQFNADTSLTTTNLVLKWRLETPSTYTVNSL